MMDKLNAKQQTKQKIMLKAKMSNFISSTRLTQSAKNRNSKATIPLQIFCVLSCLLSGCANLGKELKSFLKGNGGATPAQATQPASSRPSDDGLVRYSESKDMPFEDEREYRRMTRKEFEDQALRSDGNGSLWVMEGQDSYLFAENNVRLPGDLINVNLEGQPEKQLSTKAKVIKDLTKKIEAKRKLASQSAKSGDATPEAKGAAAPAAPPAKPEGGADAAAGAKSAAAPNPEEEMDLGGDFDVRTVPSRIVEKLSDGNYRVKGSQNFMIGSKEYKVIVTGLVKPADVNNNIVDASKILDSKFDIVRTVKR